MAVTHPPDVDLASSTPYGHAGEVRIRTVVGLSIVGACALAGGGFAIQHAHERILAQQEAPAADASVGTVTRAYLRAAERHDCALTSLLTTSNTFSWCGAAPDALSDGWPDLRSFRDLRAPEHVSAEVGGRSQECVASTIDQRWMTGAEPGELQWNWCWVHTSGGWRLWDQGQG